MWFINDLRAHSLEFLEVTLFNKMLSLVESQFITSKFIDLPWQVTEQPREGL